MRVLYDECLFGNVNDRITVYESALDGTLLVSDTAKKRNQQCFSVKSFVDEYKDVFEPSVLQSIVGVDIYG